MVLILRSSERVWARRLIRLWSVKYFFEMQDQSCSLFPFSSFNCPSLISDCLVWVLFWSLGCLVTLYKATTATVFVSVRKNVSLLKTQLMQLLQPNVPLFRYKSPYVSKKSNWTTATTATLCTRRRILLATTLTISVSAQVSLLLATTAVTTTTLRSNSPEAFKPFLAENLRDCSFN